MKIVNLKLLNEPIGTEMYLVESDRLGDYIDIKTVKYNGFKLTKQNKEYFDPGKMRFPMTYEEQYAVVKFGNEEYYMEYIPYWKGQRAFDTDEHLGCGDAKYPYIDVYFTTNKDKLKKYLNDNGFLTKLEEKSDKITKTIDKIRKIV